LLYFLEKSHSFKIFKIVARSFVCFSKILRPLIKIFTNYKILNDPKNLKRSFNILKYPWKDKIMQNGVTFFTRIFARIGMLLRLPLIPKDTRIILVLEAANTLVLVRYIISWCYEFKILILNLSTIWAFFEELFLIYNEKNYFLVIGLKSIFTRRIVMYSIFTQLDLRSLSWQPQLIRRSQQPSKILGYRKIV